MLEAGIAPVLGLQKAHRSRPVERGLVLADHLLFGTAVAHSRWPRAELQRRAARSSGD